MGQVGLHYSETRIPNPGKVDVDLQKNIIRTLNSFYRGQNNRQID
ncbi:hypothetical protein MGA3_00960 [Bacillus methanolicus MGA3]|nr:hypothetical protein MGA3_00960 [Bacillus methanolicus MGA3]